MPVYLCAWTLFRNVHRENAPEVTQRAPPFGLMSIHLCMEKRENVSEVDFETPFFFIAKCITQSVTKVTPLKFNAIFQDFVIMEWDSVKQDRLI